jgi:hypothetical protein
VNCVFISCHLLHHHYFISTVFLASCLCHFTFFFLFRAFVNLKSWIHQKIAWKLGPSRLHHVLLNCKWFTKFFL